MRQTYKPDIEEEIVVVMAGSGDDARKFKSVKLVKTPSAAAKTKMSFHTPATIKLAAQSPVTPASAISKLTPVRLLFANSVYNSCHFHS